MFDVNYQQVQQQAEAWQQARHPHQPDPVREVVKLGAAFMLGRSVAGLFQKQAASATHRCW